MTPSRPAPTVAREADEFEATLKAARVPEKFHDLLWDVWVGDAPRAIRMAQAYATPSKVTTKAGPAVSFKATTPAAPGMTTIEVPVALAAALTAARARGSDADIIARLSGGAAAPATGGSITDAQKVPARKEVTRSLGSILDSVSQDLQRRRQ